jgi:hypothetical protein
VDHFCVRFGEGVAFGNWVFYLFEFLGVGCCFGGDLAMVYLLVAVAFFCFRVGLCVLVD